MPAVRWVEAPTPPWSEAQQAALDQVIEQMMVALPGLSSAELAGRAKPRPPTSPMAALGAAAPKVEAPFSGAAVPMPAAGGRGFWFNINAELIVYGATEPDATVILEGRPIRLRPDGSFTLRFALPDGDYALPAEAVSADGVEARAARLAFARRTTYRGSVEPHPTDPALSAPPSPTADSSSRKASRRS